jgi:hypothetical protein
VDRAFEVVHQIHADAHRRSPGSLRCEVDLRLPVLHAVDIVAEDLAVVYRGHVIPGAERMQTLLVHQCRAAGRALVVAVQEPAVADHADLEEHPVLGPRLLEMKPALLGVAAVGAENRLPGERRCSGKRMYVHEQRISDAVELNGFADRCVDHPRVALNGGSMLTEAVEPVEHPHFSRACLRVGERADGGRDGGKSHQVTFLHELDVSGPIPRRFLQGLRC